MLQEHQALRPSSRSQNRQKKNLLKLLVIKIWDLFLDTLCIIHRAVLKWTKLLLVISSICIFSPSKWQKYYCSAQPTMYDNPYHESSTLPCLISITRRHYTRYSRNYLALSMLNALLTNYSRTRDACF